MSWSQKLVDFCSKTAKATDEEETIKTSSISSKLIENVCITSDHGILTICTTKGYHAFLIFEYLEPATDDSYWVRCIRRIDFGPDRIVDVLYGKGILKDRRTTNKPNKRDKLGPHWILEVEKVNTVFDKIMDEAKNGELSKYSMFGDSSNPKRVNNCLTMSRNILLENHDELGIELNELDCILGWTRWVPIQLSVPLVNHFKWRQDN